MAIRIQIRRDTAANWTSANPVLRAGEFGVETDTLKFKIGNGTSTWTQITSYANVTPTGLSNSLGDYILSADQGNAGGPAELDSNGDLLIPENSIILWDDAEYTYTSTVTATQPTANRTITLPDATGTVALAENVAALSGATFTGNISVPTAITFEGATANDFETTIQVTDPTADRTITIPDVGGTFVTTGDTGSVTNTMLAGSISNDKLSNSAITINGTSTSLGGSRTLGTDDVSEGTTNKYFTDERAQDAIATAIAAGTHTNITITYDDSTNKFTFVGANTYSDENAQDAVGNALGTGLSYNDTTGAISVDTTTIQTRVADVSDTEIGYLNNVTSAIQTQLDDKSTASKTETLTNKTLTSPVINTPTGITKSDVGLANVDNTTDLNKPVSTATQTALDLKAPIASPTFTGTVTLPGAPTSDLHAATKAYVDASTSGLNVHDSVKAATTEHVNINNGVEAGDVIDGVTLAHNDRILIKNQNTTADNGIYIVQPNGAATRATDYDAAGEVDAGDFIFVENGTVNSKTGWIQTNAITTLGTDPIVFTQFSGAGTYLAGNGLTLTGNSFSINTGTTADLSTAQTLTNKTLTSPVISSITNTGTLTLPTTTGTVALTSDITVSASSTNTFSNKSISLASNVVTGTTAEFNAALSDSNFVTTGDSGTVTSTMILDGTIVNSDINASAAIAQSKIDGLSTSLSAKADLAGPTFTGTVVLPSTTSIGDVDSTELSYLNGVTSAIQTQLNGKSATGHTHTATDVTDFTEAAQDAIGNSVGTGLSYNDSTGAISVDTATIQARVADVSDTEIGYLNGVTSAIQTQLDGKVDESLFDTKGDILVASADNTPAKLAAGTNGYLLTANSSAANGIEWAAAPVSLPSQSGESGKYLTTDGTTASWGTLVVPITTGTSTVSANTATTIDTTALSAFTSIEYMVSLKQGSKVRTSKVVVQTDGTSVDMTEFAITETGGTIAGVVVSAAVASTNAVLQLTATDAVTTNVTVKFSKVAL
jgi:hypothetical protein